MCHSKTKDLAATLKQAEVVVVAAGRAHLIGADFVRAGQIIVDVGINWDEATQKLVGDVNTEQVAPLVSVSGTDANFLLLTLVDGLLNLTIFLKMQFASRCLWQRKKPQTQEERIQVLKDVQIQ